MSKLVIGTSANVEAEYGCASELPFTLLIIDLGEVIGLEGFNTKKGVIAAAKEENCETEFLFIETE